MRFIDLDLARRVEMAEANAGRECAEACRRFHPEHSVAIEEIAGGIAVFAGVDSPITQAIGVGLHGPVSDADVDALGSFFHSRNARAAIELCPLVDISLYEKLAARNYHLLELTDVLILDGLAEARIPGSLSPGVTVRASAPHEAKLWTQTVAEGFAEHYPVTPAMLDVMEGFYGRRDACFFLAFVDGDRGGWWRRVSLAKESAGFLAQARCPHSAAAACNQPCSRRVSLGRSRGAAISQSASHGPAASRTATSSATAFA